METQKNTYNKPIFIVGCQRSGTTLLRLILNAHSCIAIPEEARFLAPLLKYKNIDKNYKGAELLTLRNYLKNNKQFALWNFDSFGFFAKLDSLESISLRDLIDLMFSSYCAYENKTIWGDKSLFFGSVPILHRLFPDARFIHIIRDGRDVFDSWRKIDKTKSNPAVISLDWAYKEKSINTAFDKLPDDKKLSVKYEDLINSPGQMIKKLCNFLEIPFEHNMLEFYKSSKKYIGGHHSGLIFNKINSDNSMKWKKALTESEIRIFTCLSRGLLRKYGYETKDINPGLKDYFKMAALLFFGIPYRVSQVVLVRFRYDKAMTSGSDVRGLKVGDMPAENRTHT